MLNKQLFVKEENEEELLSCRSLYSFSPLKEIRLLVLAGLPYSLEGSIP